jgi:uncharacterized repeat protein (TIGR01451 family)
VIAAGGTAKFRITVTNTGDVTLTDVTVNDPRSPNCNKILGVLTAGASRTYACTRTNVSTGFTNIAKATGTPPTGADVSDNDSALVKASPLTPPDVTTKPSKGTTSANKKPRLVAHTAPKTTG